MFRSMYIGCRNWLSIIVEAMVNRKSRPIQPDVTWRSEQPLSEPSVLSLFPWACRVSSRLHVRAPRRGATQGPIYTYRAVECFYSLPVDSLLLMALVLTGVVYIPDHFALVLRNKCCLQHTLRSKNIKCIVTYCYTSCKTKANYQHFKP